MGNRRTFLIHEIVKYSQKIDQKGFAANHDGNISAKLDDVLLATPSAVSKGNIVADMIITLDSLGKKIEGIGKPFSEIKLHLEAYQMRPDAKAVVHAHPPFTTARGLVNLPLEPYLPEAIVSIGNFIPVDANVSRALSLSDVLMIPGNGVLAIGDDVEQAYLRVELIEHLAKIEFYAKQMGTLTPLKPEEIQTLLEKRKSIGLGPQAKNIPFDSTIQTENKNSTVKTEMNFRDSALIDPSILVSQRDGEERATGVYKQYMTVASDDANKAESQKTKGILENLIAEEIKKVLKG